VHFIVKLPGIPILKLIVIYFSTELGSLVPMPTAQVSSVTTSDNDWPIRIAGFTGNLLDGLPYDI
jgi:hypothetical protein